MIADSCCVLATKMTESYFFFVEYCVVDPEFLSYFSCYGFLFRIFLLLGGRAPEYLSTNEKVISLVQYFAKKNKPIASICHGPLVLAAVPGFLKGKKCTAYPALEPVIKLAQGIHLLHVTGCFFVVVN